jgi:two-component system, cell cycle sensor histidine kinase and response regulator CckA
MTEGAGPGAAGVGAVAARLAAIVELSDDAIIATTLDGVITSWNAGATAMYGYAPEEMIGHNITELIPADRAGELTRILGRLRRGERVEHYETRRVRKDGTVLDVSVSVSPVLDPAGAVIGAASVARDISFRVAAEAERQALEARLRQAERLETLGQLAGGVAHDFNNLLSVIVGYAELMTEEAGGQPGLRADAEQILGAAQRAARLTRQLLIFSGRDTAQPQAVDLSDVVAGMRELLVASLGSQVELVIEPAPVLPLVRVNRGHAEQVLLNLAVNARDAMPGGGTLRIGTGITELDAGYCAGHPHTRPGRYVQLTVADTGAGMSPEVAARAFEPFFTTKPPGRGTGLGLATVYGVMAQAGGGVSIESREGAGALFRCFFPPVAASAGAATGGTARRRILVVDDEPGVLAVTSRILRKGGYEVVEAQDAAEALSLLSSPEFSFDLLLTDSVMPGMSGAGLAERVARLRPGMRVLNMSGYAAAEASAEQTGREEAAFIEKPFTAGALLEKVRSVLGARPPG